jgi:hypothetical protein
MNYIMGLVGLVVASLVVALIGGTITSSLSRGKHLQHVGMWFWATTALLVFLAFFSKFQPTKTLILDP